MDINQKLEQAKRAYLRALTEHKRANTIHEREQERGKHDLSPRQTRRMYLAVGRTQRAYRKLADSVRTYERLIAEANRSASRARKATPTCGRCGRPVGPAADCVCNDCLAAE